MANPFLIGDAKSTFADSNNTFNPFLTNTSSELESHNDNPFFSAFSSTNSVQDNTNPFLAFTQAPEPAQPIADLLGINEKSQTTTVEDTSKVKPPPPRPAPPKRPPPRPTAPSHDAKELILSVTGEMDATSLHLLDRLAKTPSPTPMRDLLSPSPTPTADLLGYEDLQPPIMSQTPSVFDQPSNIIDLPSGPKPERPKCPPKIDFLMDDLLADVPIDEDIKLEENIVQSRTPSIPENQPITAGSIPASRKSSNEYIPPVRRLSHDVTESRKIMPDLSKIADRRKSDIGHFAPILPSRKPTSQSDQSLQENKSENILEETHEQEDKSNTEVVNNVSGKTLITTTEVEEKKLEVFPDPPKEDNVTWHEEKNGLDFDSKQLVESQNQSEIESVTSNKVMTPPAVELSPFESTENENVPFNDLNIDSSVPSTESFPTAESFPATETFPATVSFPVSSEGDESVSQKPDDSFYAKPIPPVPDPSPFQEVPSQETTFNAVFDAPQTITASPFDTQESQQLSSINSTVAAVSEPFSTSKNTENDAFDAFAAKFDDSKNYSTASGGAFDAFGGTSGGAFEDSTMGFGIDDNFDSFLSTHQIPAAPQSTPARVTRNNSKESVDENDFNVFIRYQIFVSIIFCYRLYQIMFIFRPKTESDTTDQSAVPSIAPPPKVPTSIFQDGTPSRFNPFDQEPSGETSYKIHGQKLK